LPLQKKARIEVYLPRSHEAIYSEVRSAFEQEFIQTFGGYTLITEQKGTYVNANGEVDVDVIDILYVDMPFDLETHRSEVANYAAALKEVVMESTAEESVLIVIHETLHVV
jgi:hypothetical protein